MKITIHTTASGFDPAATCTPAQLERSLESYGREIETAVLDLFPHADFEHRIHDGDVTMGIHIQGADESLEREIWYDLQETLERVYAEGNFWA